MSREEGRYNREQRMSWDMIVTCLGKDEQLSEEAE